MEASPAPPPRALAGMRDWTAEVAWALNPDVRTWRLRSATGEIRYLKVARLGRAPGLAAERARMEWAAAHLNVPRVLGHGADGASEWVLTAGLPGTDASRHDLRADPARLVPLLAAGLRRIHSIPASTCPFGFRLRPAVAAAGRRVAAGLVNPEQDLNEDHGGITAEEALARLLALRPEEEDLVVCHGDYCLPNVLVDAGVVSGYVDVGRLGVADRWWDLAVATWSCTWNLGPGWEDLFLKAYGVPRDPRRMAFYRLLYDLVP